MTITAVPPTRRSLLLAIGLLPFAGLAAARSPAKVLVEVWKDPSCGCCQDWVTHLEANGFAVKANDTGNNAMRARLGIPRELGSCHTALVGGYAVEGHVPAADIRRLLLEKPQAIGIAVPGMPVGSPGMDGALYGGRRDPYDVLLVRKDGTTQVFSSHNVAQASGKATADATLTEGEVRKVDKAARKITLRHGEIRNLDMPPMTMVFRVQDPAGLDKLKVGDKVRFRAARLEGDYVVTTLEALP